MDNERMTPVDQASPEAAAPAAPQAPLYTPPVYTPPARLLKTNRGLLRYIIFSIITLGIYPLVLMSCISDDINTIASRYDGRKTMHFCLILFIVSPITLGIGAFVWWHRISDRIGKELRRRNLAYTFSAGTFWGWNTIGCLLFGLGPLIYLHKLFVAMNTLSADYNVKS